MVVLQERRFHVQRLFFDEIWGDIVFRKKFNILAHKILGQFQKRIVTKHVYNKISKKYVNALSFKNREFSRFYKDKMVDFIKYNALFYKKISTTLSNSNPIKFLCGTSFYKKAVKSWDKKNFFYKNVILNNSLAFFLKKDINATLLSLSVKYLKQKRKALPKINTLFKKDRKAWMNLKWHFKVFYSTWNPDTYYKKKLPVFIISFYNRMFLKLNNASPFYFLFPIKFSINVKNNTYILKRKPNFFNIRVIAPCRNKNIKKIKIKNKLLKVILKKNQKKIFLWNIKNYKISYFTLKNNKFLTINQLSQSLKHFKHIEKIQRSLRSAGFSFYLRNRDREKNRSWFWLDFQTSYSRNIKTLKLRKIQAVARYRSKFFRYYGIFDNNVLTKSIRDIWRKLTHFYQLNYKGHFAGIVEYLAHNVGNLIYQANFTSTMYFTQRLIKKQHILVNKNRIRFGEYPVNRWDIVTVDNEVRFFLYKSLYNRLISINLIKRLRKHAKFYKLRKKTYFYLKDYDFDIGDWKLISGFKAPEILSNWSELPKHHTEADPRATGTFLWSISDPEYGPKFITPLGFYTRPFYNKYPHRVKINRPKFLHVDYILFLILVISKIKKKYLNKPFTV